VDKDQQQLVRDLLDQDVGNLDNWSISFLENLENKYWEVNTPLSENQFNKLHELAKKEELIE